jgi:hypothetical protein
MAMIDDDDQLLWFDGWINEVPSTYCLDAVRHRQHGQEQPINSHQQGRRMVAPGHH